MSTISCDEVVRVAGLARIALSADEAARFAGELTIVADSVARVSEVSEGVPATSHPIPMANVFRDDVVGVTLDRGEVLASAPACEGGQFLVPQILEED